MKATKVIKPLTEECYHYHEGKKYVGAVWKDEFGWHSFSTSKHSYGSLGVHPFLNRQDAENALAKAAKEKANGINEL
jgi:hypothetical protein